MEPAHGVVVVEREARHRRYGRWNGKQGFVGLGGQTLSKASSRLLVGPEQVLDNVPVLVSEHCVVL